MKNCLWQRPIVQCSLTCLECWQPHCRRWTLIDWRSLWRLCRREQHCALWEMKRLIFLIFSPMSFVPPAKITMLSALTSVCEAASSSLNFTYTHAELGGRFLHLTKHALCCTAVNNCDNKSQFTTWRFFLRASNVLWQILLSCIVREMRNHMQPVWRGHQILLCSPYGGRRCLAAIFIKKKVLVRCWATAIVSITSFTDGEQECLDLTWFYVFLGNPLFLCSGWRRGTWQCV